MLVTMMRQMQMWQENEERRRAQELERRQKEDKGKVDFELSKIKLDLDPFDPDDKKTEFDDWLIVFERTSLDRVRWLLDSSRTSTHPHINPLRFLPPLLQ